MNLWRTVGVAVGVGPSLLSAQNSIFAGTVARDSLHHMLGSAEVRFPDLERSASTTAGGEFRFEGLPSGRYVVTIRSVGFAPVTDTVSLAAGATTTHDFVLKPAVLALDTVRSRAQSKRFISAALNAFEERRTSGHGGQFVTDSEFRRNENSRLSELLVRRIAGLMKIPVGPNTYLASGRSLGTDGGPVFLSKLGPNVYCWVTVYLDGTKIFQGPGSSVSKPPDFNNMSIADFSGAEYYGGSATVPPEFNATGTSCGVLLLWTREP